MVRKFYEAEGDFGGGGFAKPIVRRIWRLKIDFDVDWKFFAILPALNINRHSKQLEFEWLFFGVYAGFSSANYA